MIKSITVVGGGNAAHALAADLALKGFEIRMFESPQFKQSFKTTLERAEIDLIEPFGQEKTARLYKSTINAEEALKGTNYVMIAVPAFAHKHFFELIMPYIQDGQCVITLPGNFASLLFLNLLRKNGIKKDIILGEASTLPYAARLVAPSKVRILSYASENFLAALPASYTDKIIDDLKDIINVNPCENVIAASLFNVNYMLHPTGSILNVGHIETAKDGYRLYRDGMTKSVLRVIKAVYVETMRIQKALGVKISTRIPAKAFESIEELMQTIETVPGINAMSSQEIKEFIKLAFAESYEPRSMQSRYVTEDVPYGLVPSALLANKLGVKTPIINSIIELCSVVNQTNYWNEGRTLEDLGIAKLNREMLEKVLRDGF